MKITAHIIIWSLLFVFFSVSCKQILDEDIENKQPVLLAPGDGVESSKFAQTFWWEAMEGVDGYRLQIVEGDFSAVKELMMDSLIEGTNTFKYTLRSGTYTWRLRGENSNYKSKFATRTLIISDSSDLSNQEIVLSSPGEGVYVSNPSVVFSWNEIPLSDMSYRYTLKDSSNAVKKDTSITTGSLTLTLQELKYIWQVEASNKGSVKIVSESRTLYVDTTRPTPAVHGEPQTSNGNTTLTWTADDNFGIAGYRLTVYHPDSGTVYKNFNRLNLNVPQSTVPDTAGNFWWYVETVDKAGNISDKSTVGKYTR